MTNPDLYPHEIVLRDVNRYIIKSGALKACLVASGLGMLVFSTAATTILLLELPRDPSLISGVFAGMFVTAFVGLGFHLICFEQGGTAFERTMYIKERESGDRHD